MAIWQDLVDARGFPGGYQSVKRFVRKLLGNPALYTVPSNCSLAPAHAGFSFPTRMPGDR
jgi:hypothetical protein